MAGYRTYEEAQRRVEQLRRRGIWPGIVIIRAKARRARARPGQPVLGYRLTHDPGD